MLPFLSQQPPSFLSLPPHQLPPPRPGVQRMGYGCVHCSLQHASGLCTSGYTTVCGVSARGPGLRVHTLWATGPSQPRLSVLSLFLAGGQVHMAAPGPGSAHVFPLLFIVSFPVPCLRVSHSGRSSSAHIPTQTPHSSTQHRTHARTPSQTHTRASKQPCEPRRGLGRSGPFPFPHTHKTR